MKMVIQIKAELKFKHFYTCHKCGCEEIGTQAYGSFTGSNIDDLIHKYRSLKPRPHDMPVGWASAYRNGNIVYLCNLCKNNS